MTEIKKGNDMSLRRENGKRGNSNQKERHRDGKESLINMKRSCQTRKNL